MGKPIEQAIGEVEFCKAIYDFYADNAETLMADEPITLLDGEGSAFVRRSSLGVLLGIMPWNYPYYQVARFAGPNLVIGNTILLKHAPAVPGVGGGDGGDLPRGRLPGGRLHQHLRHQRADRVGDRRPARARRVAHRLRARRRRGRRDRRTQPQEGRARARRVGSRSSCSKTDDLDAAVEAAVGARLENTGQACNAGKRFIVVDELYEPFLEKFTAALTAVKPGDPTSQETTIGPLSSATAADRLEDQVKRAVEQGAKLVAGGERNGQLLRADGADRHHARQRRLPRGVLRPGRRRSTGCRSRGRGGPTGQRHPVRPRLLRDDRTIRSRRERVADKIDAGMVFVNAVGAEGAELPFGGVKRSGFGRELGRFGADEFVNKKLIRIGG